MRDREIEAKVREKEDINAKSQNRDSTGIPQGRGNQMHKIKAKYEVLFCYYWFFFITADVCWLSDCPGDLKQQGEWVERIKTNHSQR